MSYEIFMERIQSEDLSPEKYLSLNEKEKANIAEAKVVPAKLGKPDFGKIHVVYFTPTFKSAK